MAHCIVPAAEEILDKEFQVLDKGFVRLVDYYGSDSRIVQSARVSYGEGTKTISQDGALIDYLLRHQHASPFEQVVFTFHLKMPIFVSEKTNQILCEKSELKFVCWQQCLPLRQAYRRQTLLLMSCVTTSPTRRRKPSKWRSMTIR